MNARAKTSPCPICQELAPLDGPHRPFCSKRCKLVDLSKWLGGEYTIPAEEAVDPGLLDGDG
jgi:endogenous inhibitor of DNA gyrase (YacG/DUF329 family)